MGKLITTFCLITAVLLGNPEVSASADFQKGLNAAQNGDFETALREWKPLAERGGVVAQYNLGQLYRHGAGVTQDNGIAAKWWKLAAAQGHEIAQYNLGVMYTKGLGVKKDYKTAVSWYRLAAASGNARAFNNLAVMYAVGAGVLKDYVYAHMWGNLASAHGRTNGIKLRNFIERKMTPKTIAEAQNLARECTAKRYKGC